MTLPLPLRNRLADLILDALHDDRARRALQAVAAVCADPRAFPAAAWERYEETIVKPNQDPARPVAAYSTAVRRRRKGVCPVHAG